MRDSVRKKKQKLTTNEQRAAAAESITFRSITLLSFFMVVTLCTS